MSSSRFFAKSDADVHGCCTVFDMPPDLKTGRSVPLLWLEWPSGSPGRLGPLHICTQHARLTLRPGDASSQCLCFLTSRADQSAFDSCAIDCNAQDVLVGELQYSVRSDVSGGPTDSPLALKERSDRSRSYHLR